jgi:CheY-like chemotaxis protein
VRRAIHVLLVEDDPLTAFNTRRALRQSPDVGAITIAIDGRDALDRLRSGALADARIVILTDLSMPRMSGLELVAAVRAEPRFHALPIVVLTTSTDDADRLAALAMHVAGYFVKSAISGHLDAFLAWLAAWRAAPAAPVCV